MARSRIGIWLVGARGGVAVSTIVGLFALQKKLISTTGLVSELPEFAALQLPDWLSFTVGGHDIRATPLTETARQLSRDARAIDPEIVAACRRDLARVEKNIQPGTLYNAGAAIAELADQRPAHGHESPQQAVDRIQADLRDFVKRQKLQFLIVVNVASTEPPVDQATLPKRWDDLQKTLSQARKCKLAASSLYAIAALDAGFPYINFTPSLGASPRAIGELAQLRETCHMGNDGKTGETLIKTVLAPLFAKRNLQIMSWVGHNIFGNLDGVILNDPENKKSKVATKDQVLEQMLGYSPQSLVSIEYVKSLGDWKTAWDHIHFRGFLGTPMKMQFLWQGCDSLLAAPLVLDLVRFAHCAERRGEHGALRFLASFFKSPIDVRQHDFAQQFQMLVDWAHV